MKPRFKWAACLIAGLTIGACAGDDTADEAALPAPPDSAGAAAAAPPAPPPNPLPEPGDASVPSKTATVGIDVMKDQIRLSHAHTRAGPVSFAVKNTGTEPHTIVVKSAGGGINRTSTIPPGQFVIMTVLLGTGDYEVYCAEGDGAHRKSGELSTLAVR